LSIDGFAFLDPQGWHGTCFLKIKITLRLSIAKQHLIFLSRIARGVIVLCFVSLNQWLRRVPSEMLRAHLNIDKETALKIPAEKLEVI
jgi:hypothetical protein